MPTVLEHLFYNYGKVSSEEAAQKESDVMSMTWLPSDPLILIIRPLEKLKKLAQHARTPHIDAQILQKGLSLTRATHAFEHALSQLAEKLDTEKIGLLLKHASMKRS